MKVDFDTREHQLEKEASDLERKLDIVRAKLEVVREMKSEASSESSAQDVLESQPMSVSQAFKEGMKAIGKFTKDDVVQWVRSKYPALEFNPKSISKPLTDMIDAEHVILIRPNIGNKVRAVYAMKPGDKSP